MEGLIPMIYKSLKRSKTLRQHKNPQPSPIQNIEDFYPDGYNLRYDVPSVQQYPKIDGFDTKNKLMQRRQNSWRRASLRYWPEESMESRKKFVRFASQRRMFSCITGAQNHFFFISSIFQFELASISSYALLSSICLFQLKQHLGFQFFLF